MYHRQNILIEINYLSVCFYLSLFANLKWEISWLKIITTRNNQITGPKKGNYPELFDRLKMRLLIHCPCIIQECIIHSQFILKLSFKCKYPYFTCSVWTVTYMYMYIYTIYISKQIFSNMTFPELSFMVDHKLSSFLQSFLFLCSAPFFWRIMNTF